MSERVGRRMSNTMWLGVIALVAMLGLPSAAAHAQQGEGPQAKSAEKGEKKEEGLPLKPARKLSFDTDEGTWVSLDISPDGKQIVFDLLGDLYLLPVSGGDAKRLTSGTTWDCQPKYSPDGKQIAFISDRSGSDNIWLIDVDGTGLHVVTHETEESLGSPTWAPDGNYLVARKWGRYPDPENYLRSTSLWLFHKDGGKGLELVKGRGDTTINSGSSFAPDGKLLYFSSHPDRFQYNVDIGRFQVHTFNRETGEIETITSEYGGGLRPILSPDGRYLVYASRHDAKTGLRTRDLHSQEEHWLTFPIQRDDQEGFAVDDVFPGYAFTPDSKSVLFTADGKIKRVDVTSHQVSTIPFLAHVDLDLAPRIHEDYAIDDGPLTVRQMRWTNESPDRKRLVFSAVGKIWIMDIAEGKPHRLTSSPLREYEPVFSPDGKWVAYVSWSDSEGGQLWKVPADGGSPVRLSDAPAYYATPRWSPDGSKILFTMGSARGWLSDDPADIKELRWMLSDGGQSLSLVALPGGQQDPAFNGDGTRVYYMEQAPPPPGQEGGRPDRMLRSIRLDGVDKKTHMRFDGFFVVAVPSPDGQWVALLDRNDAYLVAMPEVGDQAITINLKSPAVPVKRLTREGANYLHWADGGKTVTWSFADEFYRVRRDDVLHAAKPDAWKPESVKIALQVPRAIPQGKLYLRGARIVTMKGEQILERGDILIENNRIVAVGDSKTMHAPSDAKVMDVRGKTIIPGIVDIHAHLHSHRAVMADTEWEYAANLAFGVTTTRDPSVDSNVVFAQGELVAAGDMIGPRIYSTGTAITTAAASIESLEDAEDVVKRYKAHGADSLKQYMQPRRVQRQWLAMAAAKEGLNITAEGGGDLKTDLTMVLDGYTGFEHSLPIVPLHKDVIELLAQSGTTYTPTLIVNYGSEFGQYYWRQKMNIHDDPKVMRFTPHELVDRVARRRPLLLEDEYTFPQIAAGAAGVFARGGHVGLGSHGEQQGIGAQWELWMLQSGGMTPWQALYSATMHGAESIGLEKQIGSVEPGKLADLLVLNANPLENIHKSNDIVYVIKNGEVFDAAKLDEVWPAERKFPKFFWQRSDEELRALPK